MYRIFINQNKCNLDIKLDLQKSYLRDLLKNIAITNNNTPIIEIKDEKLFISFSPFYYDDNKKVVKFVKQILFTFANKNYANTKVPQLNNLEDF